MTTTKDMPPLKAAAGRIDLAELARVRAEIKTHMAQHQSLKGFPIEPNKPAPGTRFAIVDPTPRLPEAPVHDHSNWNRCSYCERDRQFADGKIVLCGDGKVRCIGNDCWSKHIDEEDWAAALADHKAWRRRADFETLQAHAFPASRAMQKALLNRDELKRSVEFAAGLPAEMQRAMPGVAAELVKAARNGGELRVERFVTNYGRLEGRSGHREAQNKGDDSLGQKRELFMVARLSGLLALNPPPGLPSAPDAAFKAICEANRIASDTDWDALSDRAFSQRADAYRDACTRANEAVTRAEESIQAVQQFFGHANLAAIKRWLDEPDQDLRYAHGEIACMARTGALRVALGYGQPGEVRLPAGFGMMAINGLADLRAAFRGTELPRRSPRSAPIQQMRQAASGAN